LIDSTKSQNAILGPVDNRQTFLVVSKINYKVTDSAKDSFSKDESMDESQYGKGKYYSYNACLYAFLGVIN
jgi:hypothetical protein